MTTYYNIHRGPFESEVHYKNRLIKEEADILAEAIKDAIDAKKHNKPSIPVTVDPYPRYFGFESKESMINRNVHEKAAIQAKAIVDAMNITPIQKNNPISSYGSTTYTTPIIASTDSMRTTPINLQTHKDSCTPSEPPNKNEGIIDTVIIIFGGLIGAVVMVLLAAIITLGDVLNLIGSKYLGFLIVSSIVGLIIGCCETHNLLHKNDCNN